MKRKYWTSPELFKAELVIVYVGKNIYTINPNIFHPEEGGQPADKGFIGDIEIKNIQMENGIITIELDKFLEDGKYSAVVDRDYRLFTSCHHTAQHIISGIAQKEFELKTIGVHIGNISTIDFEKKIDWDKIMKLETLSNETVSKIIPVETSFSDTKTDVRNPNEIINNEVTRIVTINGVDSSACCGAHVSSTGKIGFVKIISFEKKGNGTRISFLAGKKAVEFSQEETGLLKKLRTISSCNNNELQNKFSKLQNENKKNNKNILSLWNRLLPEIARKSKFIKNNKFEIGYNIEEIPSKLQNTLAQMISKSFGTGLVASNNQVSIHSNNISALKILTAITEKFGGRGGGNDKFASGQTSEKISEAELASTLKDFID